MQSLASFLDSVQDLACDGAVDEDVMISALQNALAPTYANILAERIADATANISQLTLDYVLSFLRASYVESGGPSGPGTGKPARQDAQQSPVKACTKRHRKQIDTPTT